MEAGAPAIVPVNYLVDGSTIVVRALEGGKVDTAVLGEPVAFEVDDHDPARGTGWSVVVHGRALLIDDPERIAGYAAELDSWAASDESRTTWIRIVADQVTGRRLRRH
jgi:nitroimidazol reductase NimA-like FMN-containing flavoprotein (pyridoxamine 5'-phosphate oxidase superfamily)